MKIFVGQIYIQFGVSFPFSIRFQQWLGNELTQRVEASRSFRESFPGDFKLGFRVSAKSDIEEPEIKGPTVFKRTKDVEFTIFLPHKNQDCDSPTACQAAFKLLLQSMIRVLDELEIDSRKLADDLPVLLEHFSRTPDLIENKRRQTP